MHHCIYSQCMNAFIYAQQMHLRIECSKNKGACSFLKAKKNPPMGGFYLTVRWLTGVHAPPEDVTEDHDLLFLHFLEAVVLVRVLIAIEAAQSNPGRQPIKLFHP
ncbi:hypothetical protein SAMN04490202_1382 [Pseudomonas reinekei]|uniref:Uncharacterized protein n=1 Tax=Pseudomonas reinekei TaxID=395598 RepID=A0A1H0KY21_PSERE|nr:hypothetical protein SAMN04490202_1382 [Pseudomonas reinekei]